MELLTTSPLRTGLCALIVGTAYRGTAEAKRALADHLDVLPFERMGDRALIGMAEASCDPAAVAEVLTRSADRYVVEVLALCRVCSDQHWYDTGDGWARCPNCNVTEHES
jgi:hypothetical protein